MRHEKIEGWLDEPMIEVFREQVENARDGAIFVELGTYKGKSAACIAELIQRSGKDIRLYTVDDYDPHVHISGHSLAEAVMNLGELAKHVDFVVSKSWEGIFGVGEVQFCYVDASHEYEPVCRDLDYWGPRAKVLAGDDYLGGVKKAVDERFAVRQVGRGWVRA